MPGIDPALFDVVESSSIWISTDYCGMSGDYMYGGELSKSPYATKSVEDLLSLLREMYPDAVLEDSGITEYTNYHPKPPKINSVNVVTIDGANFFEVNYDEHPVITTYNNGLTYFTATNVSDIEKVKSLIPTAWADNIKIYDDGSYLDALAYTNERVWDRDTPQNMTTLVPIEGDPNTTALWARSDIESYWGMDYLIYPPQDPLEQPEPPVLDATNDLWTVSWPLETFGWEYLYIKLYRADLPPGSKPLGPQETPPPEYIPPGESGEPYVPIFTEVYASKAIKNAKTYMPHNVTEHVTKQEPGIYYATIQGLAFKDLTGPEKYEMTGKPEYKDPNYVVIDPDDGIVSSAESEPSNEITETILKSSPPNLYVDQDPVTKEAKWLVDWGVPDTVHNYVALRLYWAATPSDPATTLIPTDFTKVYESKAVTNGVGHAPFDVTDAVWDKGTGIYVATAQGIGSRDEFGILKEYGTSSMLPWIGTTSIIKPADAEANPMDGRRTSVESDFSAEVEAIPQTMVYDSATLLTNYMTSNHYDLIFAIEGLVPSADPLAVGNIPPFCNFKFDKLNKAGLAIESLSTEDVGNKITYSYDQIKYFVFYRPGNYKGLHYSRVESSKGALFIKVPVEAGAVGDFDIKMSIKAGERGDFDAVENI